MAFSKTSLRFGALPLLALGVAACAQDQGQPAGPDATIAEAQALAGEDLQADWRWLCPQPPQPEAGYHDETHVTITPTRVFDEMDYVGHSGVGASIFRTSEGLVLIDSMTTDAEVEEILLPGLAALGLDVAEIRYIIVTHGHGDHHGGVQALRRLNPDIRVVMSETDWEFSSKPFYMRDGTLDPAPRPERQEQDIGYAGEMELAVGDTVFRLHETPGHTPGTTSLIYPVHLEGLEHMAMQWGGGNPTQASYAEETVAGFMDAARRAGVTVRWSSHAQEEDIADLEALAAGTAETHPFVYSTEQIDRWYQVMTLCRSARLALED